jgi:hypothetical protein
LEYRFDLEKLEPVAGGLSTSDAVRAQTRQGKVSLTVKKDGDSRMQVKIAAAWSLSAAMAVTNCIPTQT